MRHPPIVTVRQRLQQDAAHVPGLLLVIKALLHNSVKQLSAVHGLHDEVKHFGLFEKVVEADNVGAFSEVGQDSDLVDEGGRVFFRELFAVDALDGVGIVGGALVDSGPDGGEGSGSELVIVC